MTDQRKALLRAACIKDLKENLEGDIADAKAYLAHPPKELSEEGKIDGEMTLEVLVDIDKLLQEKYKKEMAIAEQGTPPEAEAATSQSSPQDAS